MIPVAGTFCQSNYKLEQSGHGWAFCFPVSSEIVYYSTQSLEKPSLDAKCYIKLKTFQSNSEPLS